MSDDLKPGDRGCRVGPSQLQELIARVEGGYAMTVSEQAPLQDQIARIIDPAAWSFRGLWPDGLGPGPHREVRIKAAEEAAAEENNRAKAVSLAKARQVTALILALLRALPTEAKTNG